MNISAIGGSNNGGFGSALSSAGPVPGPDTAAPVSTSASSNVDALKQMFSQGGSVDLQA